VVEWWRGGRGRGESEGLIALVFFWGRGGTMICKIAFGGGGER